MNKIAVGAYCHIFYIGFIIAFFNYTLWHSLSPVEGSQFRGYTATPDTRLSLGCGMYHLPALQLMREGSST